MEVPFGSEPLVIHRHLSKVVLACLLLFFGLISAQAIVDTNAFVWAKGGGGPLNDKASSLAIDVDTNVIVVGDFSGSAILGGVSLTAAGSSDVFVCKYSHLGEPIWSKRFGAALDDSATGVATDTNGNIYVSGYYRGVVDFGGKLLAAHGGSTLDGFVAKLNRDGVVLWANSIGGSGDDRCFKVTADPQGNVYAAGTFQSTVAFGPGVSLSSTNTQVPEAFLARYTAAGAAVWARRIGGTQGAAGYGVAVGPDGNPCVTGEFVGTGSVEGVAIPNSGDRDVFLVKYSAKGDRMWSTHFGADGADGARALTADASGNLIVGGYFSGAVNFGGGSLSAKARKDFFILRTASDGTFQWAVSGGGLQDDSLTSVSTTASGSIYAVGSFGSILSTGGADLISAGTGIDAFLLRLDPNGGLRNITRAGGSGVAFDSANAVATGPMGLTFIAGEFSSLATFGTNSLNSGSVTNRDYFVARRFSTPPDITGMSTDILAVLGDPFQLQVVPSGEGPFYYQWEQNGTVLVNDTNATLIRSQSVASDNGDFTVLVSNAEGSVRSPVVGVHLYARLTVTAQGRGQAIADPVLLNYALGSSVSLLALPDADAFFSGWSGDIGGTVNPTSIVVDGHRAVIAVFGSRRLDLGKLGEGNIQATPIQELYNAGDVVILNATAAKYYQFVAWSDGELNATRHITIGISNRFVATFTNLVPVETLTLGGVSRTAPIGTPAALIDGQFITQGPITRGDIAELKFTTSFTNATVIFSLDGSPPSQFYDGPILLRSSVRVRAIAFTEDFTQSAEMDEIEVRVLTTFLVSATTPGAGQIAVTPQKARYFSNELVTLTATPSNGWRFLGWNADIAGTNPITTFPIREHLCVEAVFGTEVALIPTGAGEIRASPSFVAYPYGSRVRFTGMAADGSNFVSWNGAISTPVNPVDVDILKPSPQVRALFLPNGASLPLRVSVDGDGTVVISPRRNLYNSGDTVLLFASSSPGANFLGWSGGLVAATNRLSLKLTNAMSLQATFTRIGTLGWVHCGAGKSVEDLRLDVRSPLGSVADLEWSTDQATWHPWGSVTNPLGHVLLDVREAPTPFTRFFRLH